MEVRMATMNYPSNQINAQSFITIVFFLGPQLGTLHTEEEGEVSCTFPTSIRCWLLIVLRSSI
jgi:hypothetical protein